MTVFAFVSLLRVAVGAVQLIQDVKKAYDSLTPQQKEELHNAYDKEWSAWQEAIKKVQDPMAGPMDGP